MKVTGTREAFRQMLNVPNLYTVLGVSHSTVANWKRSIEGVGVQNPPTLDKMEEMLRKYGAEVVKEKVWNLPA